VPQLLRCKNFELQTIKDIDSELAESVIDRVSKFQYVRKSLVLKSSVPQDVARKVSLIARTTLKAKTLLRTWSSRLEINHNVQKQSDNAVMIDLSDLKEKKDKKTKSNRRASKV